MKAPGLTAGHKTLHDNTMDVSRKEKVLWAGFLTLALLLRIVFIFHRYFNTDEPQHLHVVLGWAHGLIQYRDIFDNHMPLFHILFAPFVRLIGDRADLLVIMRLTMLPIWGMTLFATYIVASALWDKRIGWWTVILTSLFPAFFKSSLEFRTDDLLVMLWMLSLAVLVSGRMRLIRSFFCGVLLGAAFGVSMKSVLLLMSLALGGVATMTLCLSEFRRPGCFVSFATNLGTGIVGGMLIPFSIVAWFKLNGAFGPFYYGVIEHNLLHGLGRSQIAWLPWVFIPSLLAAWTIAWLLFVKGSTSGMQTTKRVLVFMTFAIYVSALETLWPLIEKQQWLPAFPLLMVFVTPFINSFSSRLSGFFSGRYSRQTSPGYGFLLGGALFAAIWLTMEIPWQNEIEQKLEIWKAVLSVTNQNDYVMDLKGELLFRPRSVYYVFENITKARIARGLIDPQIPKRLIETKTCVVSNDFCAITTEFGPKVLLDSVKFIQTNYVSVGPFLVAGQSLSPRSPYSSQPISFEVVIPSKYQIITPLGPAVGDLDGMPYRGTRFLNPGRHEFRPSFGEKQLALVWDRAVEKGFLPFAQQRETL